MSQEENNKRSIANYISPEDFGMRLRIARKNKHISQSDMARELKIAKSSLCSYEAGLAVPSLDKTYEIAEYLGVSIDSLVGRSEELSNRISSMSDIADILLRLCEFECVELTTDERFSLLLRFANDKLYLFFGNIFEMQKLQNSSNVDEKSIKAIRDRLINISMENLKREPAIKKSMHPANTGIE